MADSMLVYVENHMKSIKKVRIDKWFWQADCKMYIEIQKYKMAKTFKKDKGTYTTWFQDLQSYHKQDTLILV